MAKYSILTLPLPMGRYILLPHSSFEQQCECSSNDDTFEMDKNLSNYGKTLQINHRRSCCGAIVTDNIIPLNKPWGGTIKYDRPFCLIVH